MKKTLFDLVFVAIAITLAFSCARETVPSNDDQTPQMALRFVSERPNMEDATKTEWDGNTVVWSETDKIRVGFTFNDDWWGQTAAYSSASESPNNHIKFYASNPVSIDEQNANIGTFIVPNDNFVVPSSSGSYIFYAIYPMASISNNNDSAPVVNVTLKTSQTPAVNSFDPSTDIMVGTTQEITSSGLPSDPIDITWNRVVAHAALTFSNMAFVGTETPTKITLTFNDDALVAGSFSVNIADGSVDSGSANTIILEGSGMSVNDKNINVWATVLPVSFSSLNVEIKTDKAIYTRNISSFTGGAKTFKQNARNTLSINMSTATRTASEQYEWVKKDLSAITSNDVFVIVGNNGSNYAMSNGNGTGSAPSAIAVTVADNKLSTAPADNIQWTLSKSGTAYTFYPNGTTSTWLYCTNTNNGVRVGTNTNKTFTLSNGYLKHEGTSRYVGVYNSQDWRCYSSTGTNIGDQTFAFYVKTGSAPAGPSISVASPINLSSEEDYHTISITRTNFTGTISVSVPSSCEWLVADESFDDNDFEIYIEENTGAERTVTITLSGSGIDDQTIEIIQEGLDIESLPYVESFSSNIGKFTINDVNLGSLSYVWSHDNSYHYMKASSYVGGNNNAAESWLVSPILEIPAISGGETIKLKFSQVVSVFFGTVADEASLMVRQNGGSWTKINITYPEVTSGNFSPFEEQIVNLSSYAGKNIQFAFKYIGTTSACGTWEIKDVSVKKYEPLALSSISVSGQKTIFTVGDTFEFGGTVTATYNDETTADVTSYASFSGYNLANTGNQTVTVSYTEDGVTKTATYQITVAAAGVESLVYTLQPVATGGNSAPHNNYASAATTTISGIEWSVTGNSSMVPWRIGGKKITSTDRDIYSTTAIAKNISKIDITHGSASDITVNSMTVIVSKNSNFSSPVSTVTASFAANSTVTINRPSGADWSNCYYKIVYNVTVSGNSNKFLEFSKAEFTGK